MIIGINGYIGSGKDTVGKIIQYLDSEKRFQIGVKKLEQEGMTILASYKKSTSFEEWAAPKIYEGYDIGGYALYQDNGYSESWQIKKFAGKLKQIASLMTGIPVEKFEDQDFKKTYLGEEWSYSVALDRDTVLQEHKYWEEKQMTVREFLQKLGTDAVRDNLHTNAWVNALFADYKPKNLSKNWNNADEKLWIQQRYGVYKHDAPDGIFHYQEYPKWLITDTRFPNEAQAIKDRGGITVRVNRNVPIYDNNGNIKSFERQYLGVHPSETSLDDWNFDYVIDNNGSIEELIEKVKTMLEHFKLL